MTQKRIVELAWEQALANWCSEKAKLMKNPDNEITKYWVDIHFKEVTELEEMLRTLKDEE